MYYKCGKCKDCDNDIENEKYVKLGCDEVETVRVLLLGRHAGKT